MQVMLSEPRSFVDVTMRGVTLHFLQQLASSSQVGGGSWTIQEVVDRYVRPKTTAFKCCLFDIIPLAYTGRPRFFISHTWSRKLGDLVQLLHQHFTSDDGALAGEVVLWLDIVAINQHPYESKGCLLNDDVANLARVISDFCCYCMNQLFLNNTI